MTAPTAGRQDDVGRDVRLYLERSGWAATTSGDAGELWQHEDAEHAIAVPWHLTPGGPEWRGVAERLAAFQRVQVRTVEQHLQRVWVDVARLRHCRCARGRRRTAPAQGLRCRARTFVVASAAWRPRRASCRARTANRGS